jgi:hypothetical protein
MLPMERAMKLLITGLVLLAAAVAALLARLDPTTLFIGGAVCTFLGVIDLIARPGAGVAVSAGDMDEAHSLANLQRYGSVDASARFIDTP